MEKLVREMKLPMETIELAGIMREICADTESWMIEIRMVGDVMQLWKPANELERAEGLAGDVLKLWKPDRDDAEKDFSGEMNEQRENEARSESEELDREQGI